MSNSKLNKTKKEKNDEFYTQYVDIEKELQHYNIEGKTIYCNCDNPHYSNFYKYFKDKFNTHKIKHLYCTGYNKDGNGYYAEYNGTEETIKTLNGNGSFDSDECKQIMQECDIVITNPPFSLFRDYVAQLMEYGKKFLVLANNNAITYKEFFPYIKNGQIWLGRTLFTGKMPFFKVPNDYPLENDRFEKRAVGLYKQVNSICWFTNMHHIKPNKSIILTKTYNPIDYPHFDNYDAINVDKVKDIPIDYDGIMGVPITFLQYYNPSQFEIIGMAAGNSAVNHFGDLAKYTKHKNDKGGCGVVNGERVYARLLIKKNDSLEQVEFEIIAQMANTNVDEYNFGYPFVFGKKKYARILIKRR